MEKTPPPSALQPEAGPFRDATPLPARGALRQAITRAWHTPEPQALGPLLELARLPDEAAHRCQVLARRLALKLRRAGAGAGKAGLVQNLLQEFSLSSQEGIALMCMAEALLRIPDDATRDALIRDKIGQGDWRAHVGRSDSWLVNASAWGLMLTGRLVGTHSRQGLGASLGRVLARGGEPLIRKAVDAAMRLMGEQFVAGQTIASALRHARAFEQQGFRYSYDMLGEAALTADDARRYGQAYEEAIHAIGRASDGRGVYAGPGISIKLSALHPRYSRAQIDRVHGELYPALLKLARLARDYDMGLNIDAEEADRLELSLDLLERLCHEPGLQGWHGLGFVVQAYQKRCPQVIAYLIDLARRSGHRLMVRLVKGAYWDSEIKRAQVEGLAGYPVYTRKSHTDVSYLACARQLLEAPDEVYPQFATHNAQTLAAIHEMADPAAYHPGQYEFQCLHGMGEPLYAHVVGEAGAGGLGRPCRIYAPVGTHETLLAYLVRRLLENGANTSFVNRIADPDVPIETLIADPVAQVMERASMEGTPGYGAPGLPHEHIPLPEDLYGSERRNSRGWNLADERQLAALVEHWRRGAGDQPRATARIAGGDASAGGADAASLPADGANAQADISSVAPAGFTPVLNPADHDDRVGWVRPASLEEVEAALAAAHAHAGAWAATPAPERAARLEAVAQAMEDDAPALMGLAIREAGKTYANAIAEVREAVDFLRYYAAQARQRLDDPACRPLGPVACISPWNFPLAIFTGQVAAALAAGNTVLAKPAEQTPLIADRAVRLFHQAGIPAEALQLLPGEGGVVGARLVDDARVQGVMFTGSTETARLLQRALARRTSAQGAAIPLIAETGGQNAMIVDSSALAEQVVQDVLSSAFDSAGQRCSALRLLCVQEEAADRLIAMLKGAMAELRVGNPAQWARDIGPVIDAEARDGILRHVEQLRALGRPVHALCWRGDGAEAAETSRGTFVSPTLIELPDLSDLKREVFGPVLHVLRYRAERLDALLDEIAALGYGLTMGLHTRIDETMRQVVARASVGNLYINRNTVGAVVGVQPFGGEGLSGTGPKAGGPLYLRRLLAQGPADALDRLYGVQPAPPSAQAILGAPTDPGAEAARAAYAGWLAHHPQAGPELPRYEHRCYRLQGPTGELNLYRSVPRHAVLCIANAPEDLLRQLAALLAVGCRAVWEDRPADRGPAQRALFDALPAAVRERITLAAEPEYAQFDAALHQGDDQSLLHWQERLARREGVIVALTHLPPGSAAIPLERLVIERAISINTTAAGGNASLMTMN